MQRVQISRLERLVQRINHAFGERNYITGCSGNWVVHREDGSVLFGGNGQPALDTHMQLMAYLERPDVPRNPVKL